MQTDSIRAKVFVTPRPLCKLVVTLELAFVNVTLICILDNGVMKSPKRREIISLVSTCLCITKSLLLRVVIFHSIFTFNLSGQEAFFVGFLRNVSVLTLG